MENDTNASLPRYRDYGKDAFRGEVPDRLKPVFCGRPVMAALAREVGLLKSSLVVHKYKPYMAFVDMDAVCRYLDHVQYLLIQGTPYVRCNCRFTDEYKHCTRCENRGWIPASKYADQCLEYLRRGNEARLTDDTARRRAGVCGSDDQDDRRGVCDSSTGTDGTVVGDSPQGLDSHGDGEAQEEKWKTKTEERSRVVVMAETVKLGPKPESKEKVPQ